MGASSRRKGKNGELEIAALLRSHGVPARRGRQFAGGPNSPDVIGLDGVHVEVKRCELLRLWPALEQARREAREGDLASVWHRSNGREWVVILSAEDFLGHVPRPIRANRHRKGGLTWKSSFSKRRPASASWQDGALLMLCARPGPHRGVRRALYARRTAGLAGTPAARRGLRPQRFRRPAVRAQRRPDAEPGRQGYTQLAVHQRRRDGRRGPGSGPSRRRRRGPPRPSVPGLGRVPGLYGRGREVPARRARPPDRARPRPSQLRRGARNRRRRRELIIPAASPARMTFEPVGYWVTVQRLPDAAGRGWARDTYKGWNRVQRPRLPGRRRLSGPIEELRVKLMVFPRLLRPRDLDADLDGDKIGRARVRPGIRPRARILRHRIPVPARQFRPDCPAGRPGRPLRPAGRLRRR